MKALFKALSVATLCLFSSILMSAESPAEHECSRIAKKLSSISLRECLDLELQISNGVSINGAPILIKEYPPLKNRKPLGRILLVGGIHGDEYSSVSVTIKWLKILDKHHSGLFHWRATPLMNPDGLLQRKSARMNANGVDLNRNFPTPNWKATSKQYWEVRTGKNPRRYPGPTPLSEPESRWLYEEINSFKPDVIIAIHAPYGLVDYDHGGAIKAPNKLGRLHLNLLGTYPGSLGNFAGIQRQIPMLTIELKHAGIMPSPHEINHIWSDLIHWLKKNVPKHEEPKTVNVEEEMRAALYEELSKEDSSKLSLQK